MIHELCDVNNSDQDVTSEVAKSSQDLATETTAARDGDHDEGTASAWQRRRNRRELSAVSGMVSAVWNIQVVTRRQKSATEISMVNVRTAGRFSRVRAESATYCRAAIQPRQTAGKLYLRGSCAKNLFPNSRTDI